MSLPLLQFMTYFEYLQTDHWHETRAALAAEILQTCVTVTARNRSRGFAPWWPGAHSWLARFHRSADFAETDPARLEAE